MTTHARLFGSYDSRSSSNLPRITLKNYSYSPSDRIGKGFSAVVYKGINDTTSTCYHMQKKQWQSRQSIWKASRTRLAERCWTMRLKLFKQLSILMCFAVTRSSGKNRIAISSLSTATKEICSQFSRKSEKWMKKRSHLSWVILLKVSSL